MAKFRKKPVVIEAVRVPTETLPGSLWDEVLRFLKPLKPGIGWTGGNRTGSIFIKTLEGQMEARGGDWIIRGIKGEFYPCKPDIFAATYDEVEP